MITFDLHFVRKRLLVQLYLFFKHFFFFETLVQLYLKWKKSHWRENKPYLKNKPYLETKGFGKGIDKKKRIW